MEAGSKNLRNFSAGVVLYPMMKTTTASLLALLLASTISLRSQTPSPSDSPVQDCSSCSCKKQPHGRHAWLASLNDQEKAQLKAAMQKVKNDPGLVLAKQAVKDAQTKEARTAAHEKLRQVRHDLLLKADPTIGPVLDKIVAAKAAKPSKD